MGLQNNDTVCPTCGSKQGTWTDDPILTPKGLSGTAYVGQTLIKPIHIIELQNQRKQDEIDIGIPEAERTTFSNVKATNEDGSTMSGYFYVPDKKHIKELRSSSEKILEAMNLTLTDMLNYDADGNRMYFYELKNGVLVPKSLKTTWTDDNIDSSNFKIKAIHIEELRCSIPVDVEMHLINRFSNYDSAQSGAVIQALLYAQTATRAVRYVSGFGTGLWHTNDRDSNRNPTESIEPFFIPCHPNDPPLNTIFGIAYWSTDDGTPILTVEIAANTTTWNSYRFHGINSNHIQKITCIPKDDNLSVAQFELQEIVSAPELVLETPGYPCEMYVGDSWHYPVPYLKSCGFLEDNIANLGSSFNMTKETYDATVLFKEEHMIPVAGASGVSEPLFDVRRIEQTAWGISYPPGSLTDSDGYFNGVGIRGDNTCGNFSIYMPKSWLSSGLARHRKNMKISYTFQTGAMIYFGTRDYWFIDLSHEEFEERVWDPSTSTSVPRDFLGNALLAKRDDDNNVAGAVVARDYQAFGVGIDSSTATIDLPSGTIDRTVTLNIDGADWTRVNDFAGYGKYDKVFMCFGNKILFGNGGDNGNGVGYRVSEETTANITCYMNEIESVNIYARGYISIPYDADLEGVTVYVYIEYYEVCSEYYELSYPEVRYQATYISKPAVTTSDAGSLVESFGGWESHPCPSVSQANILPTSFNKQETKRLRQ